VELDCQVKRDGGWVGKGSATGSGQHWTRWPLELELELERASCQLDCSYGAFLGSWLGLSHPSFNCSDGHCASFYGRSR
jgi:hypothetical protein